MSQIREISRRCEIGEDCGMACGPCFINVVAAEMVIEDDGVTKYLTAYWVSEGYYSISTELTYESIYDTVICRNDDLDNLDRIRCEAMERDGGADVKETYSSLFETITEMVKDTVIENEFVDPDDFDDGEIEFEIS